MRISLIGPVYPYRGGIAHFTSMLAQEICKEGHAAQVISYARMYPLWMYPGKTNLDQSENPVKIQAIYSIDPFKPLSWQKTFSLIMGFSPDIVVINWWTTFWSFPYAYISRHLRLTNKKLVFLIHNTLPHEASFIDKFLTKLALSQARKYLVMTSREKEKLMTLLDLKDDQVVVQPLPIYTQFPHSKKSIEEARTFLNLQTKNPVILFFGIVRAYKGLDDVIRSIALLKEKNVNVKLLVAGEFWENEKKYIKMIKSLGISENVIIHNTYIPDEKVGVYFKAADVFVAPYKSGTQSGSIKTAMHFGIPIIASKDIADESITPIRKGICIVETGSAIGIANGIIKLLYDKKKPHTSQNLSWEKFVDAIVKAGQYEENKILIQK